MPKGVYKRTEEYKRKLSEAHKGKKASEETRRKMSEAHKGKKFSEEHLKNLREASKRRKERGDTFFSIEARKKSVEAHKGKKLSEEHLKNLREASKRRKERDGYIHSPETRKKMSESKKGEKNPMFNNTHSKDARKKISEGQIKRKERDGYINSPETRKKMSNILKGREISEEWRKKISESKKGTIAWNKGKNLSEEHKRKIGEAHKGEKSWRWNPNREEVYAPYGENFYNQQLREAKLILQNGRDMLTGRKFKRQDIIDYHHIDSVKSNDNPDNHCFLSKSNHARITNARRIPMKAEKYRKILQENTLALKNGKIPKNWSPLNKELFRQEKLKQLDLSSYII